MNCRSHFTFGTDLEVFAEILSSSLVEGSVEKEVNNAFDVVTEHQHAVATCLLDPEFLFFFVVELEVGVLISEEDLLLVLLGLLHFGLFSAFFLLLAALALVLARTHLRRLRLSAD